MNHRKTRFIVLVTLLLISGFSATSLISYFVANHALQVHIRSNTLPLTSDNIYSEIQRDMLPTIIISSLMAQDTFVKTWILTGEQDSKQIVQYLKSIQEYYKTTTAFFVSATSHYYYHSSGVLKQVRAEDPQDKWYFRFSDIQEDLAINVDIDTADMSRTNFFVNHKIHDFDGHYLGAIGVGLSSSIVQEMIELYQTRYSRQVYFIDQSGNITLRGNHYQGANNIRQIPGLSAIATQVLTSPGGSYTYQHTDHEVFLKTRLIPELNWFLLVEQIGRAESQIQNTLWINLIFSLGITLIVLVLIHLTIGKYQRRLENMATKDKLTGLDNRQIFETIFAQMLRLANRRKEPLCALLVDIDYFKQINDQFGHLVGDQVIAGVAHFLKGKLRQSDLICRWGGEEFLILLPACSVDQGLLQAAKLQQGIEQQGIDIPGKHIVVTISIGVSEYIYNESATALFQRTDQALYRAKTEGRNRVIQY